MPLLKDRKIRFDFIICSVSIIIIPIVFSLSIYTLAPNRATDADSIFHFVMGEKIWEGDIFPDMGKMLPLTIYSKYSVDHYWFYHVVIGGIGKLLESLGIDSREARLKITSVILFTFILASLFVFLIKIKVPIFYATLAPLILLILPNFASRYMMLRGAQLVIPLMLTQIYIIYSIENEKLKRTLFFLIAYFGILGYHGAILLGITHGVVNFVHLTGSFFSSKSKNVSYSLIIDYCITLVGLVAGLVVNPYMNFKFATLKFAYFHISQMGQDSANLYPETSEFAPLDLTIFITEYTWIIFFVLTLTSIITLIIFLKKSDNSEKNISRGIIILLIVFIILTLRSYRQIEYSVIFMIIATAQSTKRWDESFNNLRLKYNHYLGRIVYFVILTFILICANNQIKAISTHFLRWGLPLNTYENADSVLLNSNGLVFNTSEYDFPLIMWSTANVACLQGLSRYFLYAKDSNLYEKISFLRRVSPSASDNFDKKALQIISELEQYGVTTIAIRYFRKSVNNAKYTITTSALFRTINNHKDIFKKIFLSDDGEAAVFMIDWNTLRQKIYFDKK